MRFASFLPLLLLAAGCAPALVAYRGVEYGVSESEAVCASAFRVRVDDKVADQRKQRWRPVSAWLTRAGLPVSADQQGRGAVIDFYSYPQVGCTHCEWPSDDRWNALLYLGGSDTLHFQFEGSNRPGADPGRAFVEALLQLRAKAGC